MNSEVLDVANIPEGATHHFDSGRFHYYVKEEEGMVFLLEDSTTTPTWARWYTGTIEGGTATIHYQCTPIPLEILMDRFIEKEEAAAAKKEREAAKQIKRAAKRRAKEAKAAYKFDTRLAPVQAQYRPYYVNPRSKY